MFYIPMMNDLAGEYSIGLEGLCNGPYERLMWIMMKLRVVSCIGELFMI